jgi:hypothetical protein
MLHNVAIGENAVLNVAVGGEHHVNVLASETIGRHPEVGAEEGSCVGILFHLISCSVVEPMDLNYLPRSVYSR